MSLWQQMLERVADPSWTRKAGEEAWRDEIALNPALVFGRLGMQPDSWQQRLLESTSRQLLVCCSRQAGKALALDTPLPTPKGWTTMGEIQTGDQVFDERGQVQTVLSCSPVEFRPAYKVLFSDGTAIIADGQHLWTTLDKAARASLIRLGGQIPDAWPSWISVGHHNGKPQARTVTTEEIRTTLRKQEGECNHAIPVARSLELPEVALLIPPYVLGAWLGDGSQSDATLTSADPEVFQQIEASGCTVGKALRSRKHEQRVQTRTIGTRQRSAWCRRGHAKQEHWRRGHCQACEREGNRARYHGQTRSPWTESTLHEQLRRLGLLKNKHIPLCYLRASAEQRLALLQGLMDTDGSADYRKSCCEFSNTNSRLVQGFVELARSLGLMPRVRETRAMLRGKDCGPCWRVTFTPHLQPFRLARKAARVDPFGGRPTQRRLRYIRSVEPVGVRAVRCIRVSSPSNLYLAGEGMIPTHNSQTAAAKAICTALVQAPATVLIVSRAMRQSAELMRKVKELYHGLRGERVRRKNWQPRSLHREVAQYDEQLQASRFLADTEAVSDSVLSLELANGSRILCLPGSADTIVGFSAIDLLIIDEAARTRDEMYSALRPMLAVSQGQLLVLSTPFGKRGWFWTEWDHYDKLQAQGKKSAWERIRVTVHEVPRIDPEWLDQERESVGERWFKQEYECEFVDTIDAVFAYDDIHALVSDEVEPLFGNAG